ncbi:MAG: hypothetical protein ABIO65_09735 [Nitrospiria bacterium]
MTKSYLVVIGLVAMFAFAGCGNSNGDSPVADTSTPDGFMAAVGTMVSTAPDDTEAVDIDGIVETVPEATEPDPVL